MTLWGDRLFFYEVKIRFTKVLFQNSLKINGFFTLCFSFKIIIYYLVYKGCNFSLCWAQSKATLPCNSLIYSTGASGITDCSIIIIFHHFRLVKSKSQKFPCFSYYAKSRRESWDRRHKELFLQPATVISQNPFSSLLLWESFWKLLFLTISHKYFN